MMIRYNANVRTGNWYDELVFQDEKLKQYMRKTKNGELKVQKARQLFISLLMEVPLTFPVAGLSYGALLEIVSKENPPVTKFKVKKKQGLSLAAYIDFKNCDERSTFREGDPILGTGILTSCSRNVWTLVPEDSSRNGKELRYGDVFHIQLLKSDPPLYIFASPNRPSFPTGECEFIVPKLAAKKGFLTRFSVVHYHPGLRYETQGSVVPPFENISLLQVATAEALAVEVGTWVPTYFGMECEISIHTFRDPKDRYKPDPRNFWSFSLARA